MIYTYPPDFKRQTLVNFRDQVALCFQDNTPNSLNVIKVCLYEQFLCNYVDLIEKIQTALDWHEGKGS